VTADPAVGSDHRQVKASWRAIFTRPRIHPPLTTPIPLPDTAEKQTPLLETPAVNTPRFRQANITAIEQDNNIPYEDTRRTKRPGYVRLFWCNPNGISHHRELLNFKEIISSMRDADTSLFGLPETNLDWLWPEIRKQQCEDIMNESLASDIHEQPTI
jgi:hypothetical protein